MLQEYNRVALIVISTTIQQWILERLRAPTFLETKKSPAFADLLSKKYYTDQPRRSSLGIRTPLNTSATEQDVAATHREMWGCGAR
jgi:hypothetical protein